MMMMTRRWRDADEQETMMRRGRWWWQWRDNDEEETMRRRWQEDHDDDETTTMTRLPGWRDDHKDEMTMRLRRPWGWNDKLFHCVEDETTKYVYTVICRDNHDIEMTRMTRRPGQDEQDKMNRTRWPGWDDLEDKMTMRTKQPRGRDDKLFLQCVEDKTTSYFYTVLCCETTTTIRRLGRWDDHEDETTRRTRWPWGRDDKLFLHFVEDKATKKIFLHCAMLWDDHDHEMTRTTRRPGRGYHDMRWPGGWNEMTNYFHTVSMTRRQIIFTLLCFKMTMMTRWLGQWDD